jgi:alkylation response protein AidB-like acyl-CoA dehydrogenase
VLLEELGRAGCPAPLMDAFLVNTILSHVANQDQNLAKLLTDLHEGKAAISIALGPLDDDPDAGRVVVDDGKSDATVSGTISFVEGTSIATHLLVPTGRATEIAIVPKDARGVTLTETPGYSNPPLARIAFSSTPVSLYQCDMNDLAAIVKLARIGLAARALGAVSRGFDMIVDYAKVRTQFGKKIGQFQAIQHKLANCLMGIDVSRLAIERAAATFDHGSADWIYAGGVAISVASPALRQAVLETHHAFGGVSFWEEHEMPRHFRRAHSDLARCGGVHAARRDVARRLLDEA